MRTKKFSPLEMIRRSLKFKTPREFLTGLIQKMAVVGIATVFSLAALAPISVYGVGSPVANFSYAPKVDNPLQIDFTDTSTGDIAKWKWDFGDGSLPFIVSRQQKPEGALINISIDTRPAILRNVIVAPSFEHADLNHNNMVDSLLYYYNTSSNSLVNTNGIVQGVAPDIFDDKIAFITGEYNMRADLNGDNLLQHNIVMYYDLGEKKIISTGAEASWHVSPSISGNIIAFVTAESSINKDLDGDGKIQDWVVRYYDITAKRVLNTGGRIFSGGFPLTNGNIVAFATYEAEYKGDLNGDGDMLDMVLRYFDIVKNEIINTGVEVVAQSLSIRGDILSFISQERSIGASGADLNNDGDKNDSVVRYFDISTGEIVNTAAEAKTVVGGTAAKTALNTHLIAFVTQESSVGNGGADLNNDGDTQDDILRYYDFSAKRVVNTGAEIFLNPSVDGKIIVFITDEKTIGRDGEDLNGDGDTGGIFPDRIARYFDTATGNLHNTGAETSGANIAISDNIITFGASENGIGSGFDHNENGNIQERFLRYFVINGAPSTSSTSHIYNQIGTFPVSLIVTGRNGETSMITKNIEVREISLPLASFTATPTGGEAPLAVRFTDTSTNSPASWLWDFGDGSPESAQQNPSHTYTTPNTYTVSLTVSNQSGSNTKIAPNLITVTAPDIIPPTLSLTSPLDKATVKDTIIFKATASDNKGVNRVEFEIDNTFHSADNTSPYEYSWDTKIVSDGPHSIKAKAYDDAGNSNEAVINVTVGNVILNRPPVLDFIGNKTVNEGQLLTFAISASDADNDTLIYSAANLPSGATFNPGTRTFSWTPDNSQSGTYSNIHFEVSDGKLTDFENITITVNDVVIPPVNHPPVANAGSDQTTESGNLVQLDGSQSFDPDNDLLTYQWSQVSGTPVSIQNANQAIASFIAPELTSAQVLEFQLTVTDPGNLSSNDTTTVIVKPKPEVKPAIQITNPQNNSIIAPRSKITIAVNVKDDGKVVKKVFFLVNNKTYRASKNRQGAYSYNWTVPYGYSKTYNIKVQAQDKQKNIVADDSIAVLSSQAPRISLTNPQNNQTVLPRTSIPVTANLSPSNIGITKVEFYINDQRKYTDRNSPYSYNWRVPKETNQTYDLQARALTRSEDSSRDVLAGQSEMITVRVE